MGFVGSGDGGVGDGGVGRRRRRRVVLVGFFVDVVEVNRSVLIVFCHPPPSREQNNRSRCSQRKMNSTINCVWEFPSKKKYNSYIVWAFSF